MIGNFIYEYYDLKLEIEYEYTPMIPGKYFGLPENCYPEEPEEIEWHIDGMTVEEAVIAADNEDDIFDTVEEVKWLYGSIEERAIKEAREKHQEDFDSYESAKSDYWEDERKGL